MLLNITAFVPKDCCCFTRNGSPFVHEARRYGGCEFEAYHKFISGRAARWRLRMLDFVRNERDKSLDTHKDAVASDYIIIYI